MAEKKPIRNPVLEAIRTRRSVRRYEDKPIPRGTLNTIMEAGNWAPSGGNFQPSRFVVVEDPELKLKLREVALQKRLEDLREADPERYERLMERLAHGEDPIYRSAPVILFVIGTRRRRVLQEGTKDLNIDTYGCSMVCQNIMLAAHSLGIGSCWVAFGSRVTDDPEIVEALELKDSVRIFGPIILGYPDHYPEPPPKKPPVAKWI